MILLPVTLVGYCKPTTRCTSGLSLDKAFLNRAVGYVDARLAAPAAIKGLVLPTELLYYTGRRTVFSWPELALATKFAAV